MTDEELIARLRDLGIRSASLAADRIEALVGELAAANNEFGSQTANWPYLWRRIAELKEDYNERWRRAEKAEARAERLEEALEKMKAEQCAACRACREIEDRTALTTENRHE